MLERSVFINYRSEDSHSYGALLYTELARQFGDEFVFLDAESIPAGADFVEELLGRVRSARVLLAVIGPRWLSATDPTGRRRIDDPTDWIRRELAEAFAAGVRVIPILTDEAEAPLESDLPADITALSRCQYRHLRRREPVAGLARIAADLTSLDPVLAAAVKSRDIALRQPPAASAQQVLVPRQLPLASRDFVGRTEQLAVLDALLPSGDQAGAGTVVISAVSGTAGVGKTTLAVQWGHRVQHYFPDGTLYVNLRGYGPGEPATPGEVLAGFLSALGIPPDRIPTDVQARAGLYRSVLAGRRVLIVLDNANAAEQVRPLLPGSSGFVVVTSRSGLTGLMIGEGATRIVLDMLPEQEALDLVRAILGPRRASAEPDSLIELVRVCARLPLALRIAAGRVAADQYLTLAEVVADLGSAHQRWDSLSVPADEPHSVHAVFDWSYHRLTHEQARLFRRLGLHPGPEFSLHAAAAVACIELPDARRILDALADQNLIEPVARHRYRFHDLLRTYAAERSDQDDAADRDAARRTLLQWYAHHAWVGALILVPTYADRHAGADLDTPVHPEIVFAGPAEAWSWAGLECANMVAAVRSAVHHDVLHAAVVLADLSVVPLSYQRLWEDLFEVCHLGLAAARRLGDPRGEYYLLVGLAYAHRTIGQWQEGRDGLVAALGLARDIGDQWLQAESLYYLGASCTEQGQHAEARRYLWSARPLSLGAQRGKLEGDIELYLGVACVGLGHYEQALQHAERSLALQGQAGNPHGDAHVMHCLARAHQGLETHHKAIALCEQALRSETTIIDPREHAAILDTLGISLRHTGNTARAIVCWREALTVFEELNDSRAHTVRDRIRTVEPGDFPSTEAVAGDVAIARRAEGSVGMFDQHAYPATGR